MTSIRMPVVMMRIEDVAVGQAADVIREANAELRWQWTRFRRNLNLEYRRLTQLETRAHVTLVEMSAWAESRIVSVVGYNPHGVAIRRKEARLYFNKSRPRSNSRIIPRAWLSHSIQRKFEISGHIARQIAYRLGLHNRTPEWLQGMQVDSTLEACAGRYRLFRAGSR